MIETKTTNEGSSSPICTEQHQENVQQNDSDGAETRILDGTGDRVHLNAELMKEAREKPSHIFHVETTSNKTVFFLQNKVYQSYSEACSKKREINDERLKDLGLLGKDGVSALKQRRQSPSKKRKKPPTQQQPQRELRRSNRTRGKPVEYTGETVESLVEYKTTLRRSIKKAGQRTKRKTKRLEPLTPEQLAKLKDAHEWLEDFKRFLKEVPHGRSNKVCSSSNAESVVRQVRKLVSGEGVGYAHWPDDVSFCKSESIQLSDDMATLFERAQAHENEHGRDLGNGWLLRHPIEKLRCYQEYRAS